MKGIRDGEDVGVRRKGTDEEMKERPGKWDYIDGNDEKKEMIKGLEDKEQVKRVDGLVSSSKTKYSHNKCVKQTKQVYK